MVKLMIYAGTAVPDAPETRMGGVPLTPPGFEWPRCQHCAGSMQFLVQVNLADAEPGGAGLLSIFLCQNDPGMCSDWEPASGGNRAFVFDADALHTPDVPGKGVTLLDESCSIRFEEVSAPDYVEAQQLWQQETGGRELEVIGQLGGQPLWVQSDETPTCGGCAEPMTFVVQLQEGHNDQNLANFGGGGCGYGFQCRPCRNAAFLWQG